MWGKFSSGLECVKSLTPIRIHVTTYKSWKKLSLSSITTRANKSWRRINELSVEPRSTNLIACYMNRITLNMLTTSPQSPKPYLKLKPTSAQAGSLTRDSYSFRIEAYSPLLKLSQPLEPPASIIFPPTLSALYLTRKTRSSFWGIYIGGKKFVRTRDGLVTDAVS